MRSPARWWKALSILSIAVGVAWIFVRLFTYEFVLRDDPTGGIAFRTVPGWDNGPTLLDAGSKIVLQDENGFAGEILYRSFAKYGWLICVLLSNYVFWTRWRKALKPGNASATESGGHRP